MGMPSHTDSVSASSCDRHTHKSCRLMYLSGAGTMGMCPAKAMPATGSSLVTCSGQMYDTKMGYRISPPINSGKMLSDDV